jgi:ribonucleoside-diphosphate reductase alpha chain/ribonucleoside-triphosphate reductase
MDLKVRKRDGELVDFDIDKIENAIYQASLEQVTDMEEAKEIAKEVADDINENIILNYEEEIIKVEDIQDRVEFELLNNGYFNIGKSYILYRYNRDKNRDKKSNKNELPDDFISNYKHQPNPFPTELGEYIYYRTYSRYVPEETRREKWWETVRRAVEYNTSLLPTSEDEKKKLFDNIYNFRNFVAGRTLFTAQTGGSEKFPMSNYNCSGVVIDSLDRFTDMFYLLLIGSGTGYRILPEDVEKLPKFRTDVSITHKFYEPVPTDERNEQTEFEFDTDANIVEITVGDSKEAWVKSLEYFLDFLTNSFYRDLEHIIFNYDNIRPKGERLKTFGGEASGFGALKKMYDKLDKVLKNKNTKEYNLKPIDALDFGNIIAENVVSGGVRRSAQIALFDAEDTEVAQAKSNLYTQENGEWKTNEEVAHRTNSNNSIFYRDKPSRDKLNWHVKQMRYTGEPGFVNAVEASKRRKNFEVVNPCSEILLSSQGVCNLTSLNMVSFVNDDNELMLDELLEAQRMSARAGYRMASVDFELNDWDNINKRDMLVGLSVTGWQDAMNLLGWNSFNLPSSEEYEELLEEYKGNEKDLVDTISEMIRTSENYKKQAELMKKMRETGQNAANEIAEEHGTNKPLLVTSVKPEGCLTKDHVRTLDDGILFMDEIDKNIYNNNGWKELDKLYLSNGDYIDKVYSSDKKEIIKLTLQNGRKLELTKEHPLSINNQWVEARDIKIGDQLDYKLGSYNKKTNIKLKSISLDEYRQGENGIEDCTFPSEMNEDLAWLIGAYLANGSFPEDSARKNQSRIKFHCQHKNVHERVQRIWKEQFNVETTLKRPKGKDSYVQNFCRVQIRKWLRENNLDKKDNFNRIPKPIRTSSKDVILAFITGYADNDGSFTSKTFAIDSANSEFIRHLQEVGEAVGLAMSFIVNSVRKGSYSNKPMYKTRMARAFSDQYSIDYINKHSVKAQNRPISEGLVRSKNPYIVVNKEIIKDKRTYDITVENSHMYYQGGLKSHNTQSQMPTVSSGLHFSHSEYYIRRVRTTNSDPLLKTAEELNYPIKQDPGKDNTAVIEFPIKAPEGKVKKDVYAIEQLEIYRLFMKNYVDHNASITVHVRDNEWSYVEEWLWNNWDDVVGVSFLSYNDSSYPLMPYEEIDQEEYEERASKITPFNSSIVNKNERIYGGDDVDKEREEEIGSDCEAGVCPVR